MKKYSILLFLNVFASIIFGQTSYRNLSGYVYDKSSGEPLVGAIINNETAKKYSETNSFGYYNISVLAVTKMQLKISYVGFLPSIITLQTAKDTLLNIYLEPSEMQEVVVMDKVGTSKANIINIPVERLKSVPMLLGQPDIIKALAFTPGVSTGTEGTAGLFVRGGTPDQNLILLDGATVYNASHLFGFQSAFDPSAIKDVKLIKGGFPARYGGRLSSIIDITMKEGNNQLRKSEFTLGLINSGFMTEGPVIKGKSSYMVSGRASYWGLLSLPTYFDSKTKDDKPFNTLLNYDLNVKINHEFKNKDKIFLSFYKGKDRFITKFKSSNVLVNNDLGWGNNTGSLRYVHTFSNKLFSNTLLNYTEYNLGEKNLQKSAFDTLVAENELIKKSAIREFSLKQQLFFAYGNNNLIVGGLELNRQYFNPNTTLRRVKVKGFETNFSSNSFVANTFSYAFFVENEFHIGKNSTTTLGLRSSNYAIEKQNYHFLEPRFNTSLQYNTNVFSLSYAHTSQFIHLLSNNLLGLSSDIWVPSTDAIKPQVSDLFTIGYTKDLKNQNINFTVEAYYKIMKNQIDYRQGISFFDNINTDWQRTIEKNGVGRAYGLEFMVRKEARKYNGWISYTLSRNERKFENINFGTWYPHKYDRLHNLNVTIEYKIDSKWKVASNFVYQTGARLTLPRAFFAENNFLLLDDFSTQVIGKSNGVINPQGFVAGRNNEKLPPYHRLDVSLVKSYKTKKHKRDAQLSFGVYNVYARSNPYTLSIETGSSINLQNPLFSNVTTTITGKSLFLFIPSIAYSLKF